SIFVFAEESHRAICFARPFDVTAYADSVDDDSTSTVSTLSFAMLNMHAEWVSVDGGIVDGEMIEDIIEP
ncbi:MAG: hypothetical protein ACPGXX_14580, partial [Planctomycetaceae bacterium]